MVQPLVGAMILLLQTTQDTIMVLTLMIASLTAVHIATIVSGLEGKGEIIFAQMNWRFTMKCLFETVRQMTLRDPATNV